MLFIVRSLISIRSHLQEQTVYVFSFVWSVSVH